MGEKTKTFLVAVAVVLIFQMLRHMIGTAPTLIIAACIMFFCIGALWGAGHSRQERDQ